MNGNQWIRIPKAHPTDRYAEYASRMVVIVTRGGELLLTRESDAALGNPARVELVGLANDARKFGLRSVAANDTGGYRVTRNNATSKRGQTPRISVKTFLKSRNLIVVDRTAIYRAHMEDDGVLSVDMNQRPEVL